MVDQAKLEEFKEQIQEELKNLTPETEKEENTQEEPATKEEPQYTQEEQEAIEKGWDPTYKGDNFVSAKEFIRVGSMIKRMKSSEKKLEELKDVVKDLSHHLKKADEAALEKARRELREQKLQAVNEGDVDRFNQLEKQESLLVQEPPAQPPEVSEAAKDFASRNKDWFNTSTPENHEMAMAADTIDKFIGEQLQKQGKTVSVKEHLQMVEDRIKKLYPHRFENPNQQKPSLVSKSTVSSGAAKTTLASRLTDRQLQMAKQVKQIDPNFNLEEYAKQLDSYGALKNE